MTRRSLSSTRCILRITMAMDWPECGNPADSLLKRDVVYKGLIFAEAERIASEFKIGRLNDDGTRSGWYANYVCHMIELIE